MKKLFFVFTLILLIFPGCQNLSTAANRANHTNGVEAIDESGRIEDYVKTIDGVEGANVTIMANRALVGIDLLGERSDTELTILKSDIRDKVLAFSGSLTDVTVTTSPSMFDSATDSMGEDRVKDTPNNSVLDEISVPITPTM